MFRISGDLLISDLPKRKPRRDINWQFATFWPLYALGLAVLLYFANPWRWNMDAGLDKEIAAMVAGEKM